MCDVQGCLREARISAFVDIDENDRNMEMCHSCANAFELGKKTQLRTPEDPT